MAILRLIPNTNYNVFLEFGGDTTNYKCVDDPNIPPSDDDSDYVYKSSAGTAKDIYYLPDHTSETGPIISVEVFIRARKTVSDCSARIAMQIGAATYYQDASINFSWVYYSYVWTENPFTSLPWTWSNIDLLRIGVELTNAGGQPRCTQVYANVTYSLEGTSDRSGSVNIEVENTSDRSGSVNVGYTGTSDRVGSVYIELLSLSDRLGSINIEAWDFSDRSGSVNIIWDAISDRAGSVNIAYKDLDIARISGGNWDAGGSTRYFTKITRCIRKEETNKLSILEFDYVGTSNPFTLGTVVAIGSDYESTGQTFSELFFEGIVSDVQEKPIDPNNNNYTYKITATFIIYYLSQRYRTMIISRRKVAQGGDEKLLMPAYLIRELITNVPYYDKDGNSTDLPIKIKRCPTYIRFQEYVDKTELEIFLDLAKQSPNVFYCHNDTFYFEPQKPNLGTAFFHKANWTQNHQPLKADATFELIKNKNLAINSWDLPTGQTWTLEDFLYGTVRNTSPHNQQFKGIGMYVGQKTGSYTHQWSLYDISDSRTINSLLKFGYDDFDFTSLIWQWQKDKISTPPVIDAGEQLMIRHDIGNTTNDAIEVGVRFPSAIHSPMGIEVNGSVAGDKLIWRTNMEVPIYVFMSDQIRFFNPLYPPRMMVYDEDGEQADEFFMEGYNDYIGDYCLSQVGCAKQVTGDDILCSRTLASDRMFVLARDYSYLTAFDATGDGGDNSAPQLTNNIDDDEDLVGWNTEIKELEYILELSAEYDFIIWSGNEVGFVCNFDHSGNGFDDYIACYIEPDIVSQARLWLEVVTNGSVTRSESYIVFSEPYFLKLNMDMSDPTDLKIDFKYSTDGISYYGESSWSTLKRCTGNGLGILARRWDTTYGLSSAKINIIDEWQKTINMDKVIGEKYNKPQKASQIIVIGEKGDYTIKVPYGHYPETPDSSGQLKIKKMTVFSDEEAKTAAKYEYDSMLQGKVDFTYAENFWLSNHRYLKPNKLIDVNGTEYFMTKLETNFIIMTSKVSAGQKTSTMFDFILMGVGKKEDEKEEKSDNTAPIMTEFEILADPEVIIDSDKSYGATRIWFEE